MERKCIKCGQSLKLEAEFCSECGAKQPKMIQCPKCGRGYEEGIAFCSECGTKLGKTGGEGENTIPAVRMVLTNNSANTTRTSEQSSAGQSFDTAADNLSKAAGGRGRLLAIMGGIIVVLLVIIIGMNFSGKSSSVSSNNIVVKADEMLDDYIRDQGSAEKKYRGKDITISGIVYARNQFKNAQDYNIVIAYKAAAGKDYSLSLQIKPSKVSILNSLKEGDFVNAKGTCVGIVKQDSPTDISIQIETDKVNE